MRFLIELTPTCRALLRAIDADEPTLRQLTFLTPTEQQELDTITHPAQRIEWLASRNAMQQLITEQNAAYQGLRKDKFGKPHLVGLPWHVSLSHTTGWAAAVLHQTHPVGVDIEPIRAQFTRVVPRVLSENELVHAAGDPARLAVYWCAKEALYKLYGKRQLTFRDHLLVDPFADDAEQLTGHVRLPDHQAQLTIRCFRVGPGLMAVAY